MSVERLWLRSDFPPAEAGDAVAGANAAHARAMPVQRLLDNGMDYADAVTLHTLAAEGVPWARAAEELGHRHLRRADEARSRGFRHSECLHRLQACACFRFAQSVHVVDDAEKRRLYRLVIDSFAAGAELMDNPPEKIAVPWRDGRLCGWLFLPPGMPAPPVVIVFGGADGWRESYYPTVASLVGHGLGACLLDGPGQGESRLFEQIHLDGGFADGFGKVVDAMLAHGRTGNRVGLWGNSLGGTLAAAAACELTGVSACCSNGGSAMPAEVLERFPRFLDRIRAMTGTGEHEAARILADLDLGHRLSTLRCPLLVIHGSQDQVFSEASARAIYERAGATSRRMLVWEDGDHCVYNHAAERNLVVAGWFADALHAGGPQPQISLPAAAGRRHAAV